jgi:hypothetical protein
MFRKNRQNEEQLDRAGRVVLFAAARNDEATEAAASTPFLYTRLRSAIAEEQSRRDEAGNWLPLLFVSRRAIPAMALIAVFSAILMLWSMPASSTPAVWYRLDDEALSDTRDPGVEQTILSRNALSRDDVLGIVVDSSSGRNTK